MNSTSLAVDNSLYGLKTRSELIKLCKERNIKGYSSKKKDELINLLSLECGYVKNTVAQYFTTSNDLQQIVFNAVLYKSSLLLEPSFGAGHLLKKFLEYDNSYPMICYELDSSIKPIVAFGSSQSVIYGDFTKQVVVQKFKTIIGNPPYIKKGVGNLYIKFIELCYLLLEDDGELVFIVPSDFIKLTSAASIISKMSGSGSFTHFWFPQDEKLFEGASVDVMVFRYEKGRASEKTLVNSIEMFCNVRCGIITFSDNSHIVSAVVNEKFNVYVGLVSGRDEVYRVSFGNMEILNDLGSVDKYVFAESFPTGDEKIDTHLQIHKQELLSRKIRKFSLSNWYEWGAPRNISSMKKYWGRPCIYVRNITRNKEVCFIGVVQYFSGRLLCLIPKEDVDLISAVEYFNSWEFQKNYTYVGRFKIGHKLISNALIPTME